MPLFDPEQLDASMKVEATPGEAAAGMYDSVVKKYTLTEAQFVVDENVDDFLAHLPPHGKIVELGSGLGAAVHHFQGRGFDASGIEISAETIRLAKQHFPDIHLEHQDIMLFQFSSQVDGVYEHLALMNLPKTEIAKVFGKIKAALVPGGVFQCSFEMRAPQYSGWYSVPIAERKMDNGDIYRIMQFVYLTYFQPEELMSMLEDAGLPVLKMTIAEDPKTSPFKIMTVLCTT